MTLGSKIKNSRKRLGISQDKLAEIMNVSRQAITKWESDSGIPDISNFSFINRKQFSVGNSYLTIYPINNTSQAIMGYTENLSEILIKYDGNEINVNVESDGSFSYPLDNVIPDNTNIEITSCVPTSFIYETRKLVTPHNGELTLVKGSNNVPFTLNPINLSPVILPKTSDTALIIVDSRINSSEFKVYVKLLKQMESETGKVLTDAVIFKNLGDSISTLNENNLLVYTGEKNKDYNYLHNQIKTIYDNKITEGFKIVYKGVVYDYSI